MLKFLGLLVFVVVAGSMVLGDAVIYTEDFTGQDGKGVDGAGVTNLAGVSWSLDKGGADLDGGAASYLKVVSGEFVGRNLSAGTTFSPPAVWTSPEIPVGPFAEVTVSLDAGLRDLPNNPEPDDRVTIKYELDGTTNIVAVIEGVTGSVGDPGVTNNVFVAGPGETLRIIVDFEGINATDEEAVLDNLLVLGRWINGTVLTVQ